MTSGRSGSRGDFADALFGSDGTSEPVVAGDQPVLFADPLADSPVVRSRPGAGSMGAPDAVTRVPGPPPLTNDAIVAAGRQLAAEQARQRSTAEANERQANQLRRAALDRNRATEQRQAAQNAAHRAGQQAQFAGANEGPSAGRPRRPAGQARQAGQTRPAPIAPQPGRPAVPAGPTGPLTKTDRAALLQRIKSTSGEERRQLAAGRGKSGSKGSWGCALFFILLILVGSGAGKEIVQAIVDALNNGR